MSRKLNDISGLTFGAWTVDRRAPQPTKGGVGWICHCDCGTTKIVTSGNLVNGRTKSCGCKRGAHKTARKGGFIRTSHPMYSRWQNMVQRCHSETDKRFARYGGRGIRVCDRWRLGEDGVAAFTCFLMDMGEPPFEGASLDRIDNDGGYSPDNVRWANATQQIRNSRQSRLTETLASEIRTRVGAGERVAALASAYGVGRSTIYAVSNNLTWRPSPPPQAKGD